MKLLKKIKNKKQNTIIKNNKYKIEINKKIFYKNKKYIFVKNVEICII